MKIHENKTLHRIVDTNARTKSMNGISKEKCDMILAIASLDRPIKQEIWDKVSTANQVGNRHLRELINDGYVTEDGTKKSDNGREFTAYKLTNLGLHTFKKILGI